MSTALQEINSKSVFAVLTWFHEHGVAITNSKTVFAVLPWFNEHGVARNKLQVSVCRADLV